MKKSQAWQVFILLNRNKKYRVSIFSDILGRKWYRVESRGVISKKWNHEYKSTSETLKEAYAKKALLENGYSLVSCFKAVSRCEDLKINIC